MTKKAFTLIELLVVVSIIGILIALSIFGLKGAREAGRDSRRKADLETIRSGIEIYKSDCNTYPTSLGTSLVGDDSNPSCLATNTYISTIPADPSGDDYYYSSDATTYRVCAVLEKPSIPADTCNGCPTCNYQVVNP